MRAAADRAERHSIPRIASPSYQSHLPLPYRILARYLFIELKHFEVLFSSSIIARYDFFLLGSFRFGLDLYIAGISKDIPGSGIASCYGSGVQKSISSNL